MLMKVIVIEYSQRAISGTNQGMSNSEVMIRFTVVRPYFSAIGSSAEMNWLSVQNIEKHCFIALLKMTSGRFANVRIQTITTGENVQ